MYLDVEKKPEYDVVGRGDDAKTLHTIFAFEGAMIYLDDGDPSALLNVTSRVLSETPLDRALCFADRLGNVPAGGDQRFGI